MRDNDSTANIIAIGILAIIHGGFWGFVGYWAGWFVWAP